MKRLILALLLVAVLVASCASIPREAVKQCGDTPRNALDKLLQGITEANVPLIFEALADGISATEVFGDSEGRRGKEAIRQITANPEVEEEGGSCTCSTLDMTDTPDSNKKIAVIKRIAMVGDDPREYKRPFLVSFDQPGNCIRSADTTDQKWGRIMEK
jgi:hypothetical protein